MDKDNVYELDASGQWTPQTMKLLETLNGMDDLKESLDKAEIMKLKVEKENEQLREDIKGLKTALENMKTFIRSTLGATD